jgi:hypothetical protein
MFVSQDKVFTGEIANPSAPSGAARHLPRKRGSDLFHPTATFASVFQCAAAMAQIKRPGLHRTPAQLRLVKRLRSSCYYFFFEDFLAAFLAAGFFAAFFLAICVTSFS